MMEQKYYAYLDDFDFITIIIPHEIYLDDNNYVLIGNDEVIELKVKEKINLGAEMKLVCNFDAYIRLELCYMISDKNNLEAELYTGKIVRTDLFDNIYFYRKNDLGFKYSHLGTQFKIWTPVAKTIKLELVDKEGNINYHNLIYKNQGVWQCYIDGDLEGYKYRYLVYVNGKNDIVLDPYGIASTENAKYNVVIDESKLYEMTYQAPFKGSILDAIIYEINIRDFTIDKNTNIINKGKYLGLIEENRSDLDASPVGFDYLKSLGITHVQIMPIQDFEGVDEENPDLKYNWGYNPHQYNIPEGSYATDPKDPYKRINEVRQMIDTLHKNGLSIVMDAVYNHVFDAFLFPFEKLVPGYAYWVDRNGIYTNVSGCHNDLNTSKKMIRKFILDSIIYWANTYKVDGFRFDLMGIIDFETMNEIREELNNLRDNIIVYGEGWRMHQSNQADIMAHMFNKNVINTISFFNDRFRDIIKGSTFIKNDKGYVLGDNNKIPMTKELIRGSANNRFLFNYAHQSINYVECHDNMTFYDKIKDIIPLENEIKDREFLATSMTILSLGVPFIHAGQEFFRTKQGLENTFKESDEINKIDWSRAKDNISYINEFKELIKIRKKYKDFKIDTPLDIKNYVNIEVKESGTIKYHLNKFNDLLIIFKNNNLEEHYDLNEYKLIYSYDKKFKIGDKLRMIGTYIFERNEEK